MGLGDQGEINDSEVAGGRAPDGGGRDDSARFGEVLMGGIDERWPELVGIDNGAVIFSAPTQLDPR